jgi:hypothetical protein
MLIMKLGWADTRLKKTVLLLAALVIIVAAFFIYKSHHKTHTGSLTHQQLSDLQQNNSEKYLKDKNYAQAELSYISSATAAIGDNDYNKALDILQEATQKIPDDKTSWHLYDTLSAVARKLNRQSLEIGSLKKALTKAQQPGSGAPQAYIDAYKDRLKQLGAS